LIKFVLIKRASDNEKTIFINYNTASAGDTRNGRLALTTWFFLVGAFVFMTMGELAKIESYCELTKTSLIFKRDITKEEWMDGFNSLKKIEGCIQFWIGDFLAYRNQKWGMYDDIAEETGYDKDALRHYKRVAENIESGLRNPDLGWSYHNEVASLPPDKQTEFLNKAVEENLSVRELRSEIRKDGIEFKTSKLPDGKYRIVYADPPWNYGDKRDGRTTGAEDHYPTMTIEQLCQLPIREMTEDNAVLFLWVTSPILNECFEVIKTWGFDYKTSFVWDKVKHNMGHYNSVRHEFLLICTKGSCVPDVLKLHDSVITEERTKHSKKPDIFRSIIDELYTYGSRVELFAREIHQGWTNWGNEV
jgi:N6-adenosine-specific RNA methylase IME4